MSSLIFFIFMIWFIMRIVKNKQKAAGQNDPKQTQGSNTPGSAATRTGSTYSTAAGSAKKSAYESAMAFQKTATGSGAGSSSSRLGNSTVGSDGISGTESEGGCPGSCAGKARGTGTSPSGNRRTYGRRAVL